MSLVALGLLSPVIDKIGLGRLPDDIVIERDNFQVYIPLATTLLVRRYPFPDPLASAPLAEGGQRSGVFAAGLPAASSSAPLAAMAST